MPHLPTTLDHENSGIGAAPPDINAQSTPVISATTRTHRSAGSTWSLRWRTGMPAVIGASPAAEPMKRLNAAMIWDSHHVPLEIRLFPRS